MSRLNPSSEIIAIDIDADIQNVNKKITNKLGLDNIISISQDIQNPTELRGKMFDLILILDVLEYIVYTSRALREINNMMHENTYF